MGKVGLCGMIFSSIIFGILATNVEVRGETSTVENSVIALENTSDSMILSDEVIEGLTIDDFAQAYELATLENNYDSLSEKEKDRVMIKIYNDIYAKKGYRKGRYLPAAYGNLNSAEKNLVKTYPSQAAIVYTASKLATNRANVLYKNGLHNGNGDAFRHTYWNAEMSTMLAGYGTSFNPAIGRANAKRWADAHEQNATQPQIEKEMDLFNNNIGRMLVNRKYTSKDLEQQALAKVARGDCRRISGRNLIKTTSAR